MPDKVARDQCRSMMLEDWKEIDLLYGNIPRYCEWHPNHRKTVGLSINSFFTMLFTVTNKHTMSMLQPEIKRGKKGYFHPVCVFVTPHKANCKQIWGNGSQALMLSDRLWARVAERVMGDERARRGSCPWQLKQLGLRAKNRVRARPRWWARHCQTDDVGPVVAPSQSWQTLSSSLYITVSSDKASCKFNRPSSFQLLLSTSPRWFY